MFSLLNQHWAMLATPKGAGHPSRIINGWAGVYSFFPFVFRLNFPADF